MPTVRDVAIDVLRRYELTTLFANPGSTEVPFLVGLPYDLDFVLALHEASVVGMATGWGLARDRPALALLHTTAGLGNAVGALATARVNRAPLVVVVGQQDRRHLAAEPFLAGRLEGLAGSYPVSVDVPVRAQDVPTALARAWHTAVDRRGPALVIVPMDDWLAEAASEPVGAPAAVAARGSAAVDVGDLCALLASASDPVLVAGAGNDSADGWAALKALAERLACPVWQEPFSARAGFPQDHPRFAGHLPASRAALREALAAHDVVLVVGAPLLRQYPYEPGPLLEPGTRAAVISADPEEVRRSPAELGLVADPAAACAALAECVPTRQAAPPRRTDPERETARAAGAETAVRSEDRAAGAEVVAPPPGRGGGEPLAAVDVLDALGARIAPETIVVEECPSSRGDLLRALPARRPLGFLSAAMGGLGFALPAAVGLRMADPSRPVVAVVGDGSSLYAFQALWSAARYRVGILVVVLANGRYAIMDRLATAHPGRIPWPDFEEIDLAATARSLGCPAQRIETHDELTAALDGAVQERDDPLLLDVRVRAD
jgi:benzoylformate decarboxylase